MDGNLEVLDYVMSRHRIDPQRVYLTGMSAGGGATLRLGAAYPELIRAQPLIEETLKLEESRFRQTLANGLRLLDEATGTMAAGDVLAFPGNVPHSYKNPDTSRAAHGVSAVILAKSGV